MTTTKASHFRKIQNFKSDYAVAEFTQYESTRTGLRVVVVDRRSTKVQGEFCLATEIHDDSGAPHTLEHLVFMGSRSYQYKGVLDKLANRAYSSTNAWTDTDHTNYTLETAGWAGFAQILPIYLEHIILPTLTDSACYTEVHHVDGDGNDAGVVYSEMQALQNSANELMDVEAKRLLFPEDVGFRYETGGMMDPLRVLTNKRIRDFHKLMYQPKNLRVTIHGQADHDQLLTILDKFEDTIVDKVPALTDNFKRPWVDSAKIPSLKDNIVQKVKFPEEDESMGEISISLFGPDWSNHLEVRALAIITEYLAGSSVSLLQNVLVEKEGLASSVDTYVQTRPKMVIWLLISSVETDKLESVEARLWQILEKAAQEPLDMDYLRDCLRRLRKQIVYGSETRLSVFTDDLIHDHLYGQRDGTDLEDECRSLAPYDELEHWNEDQWRDFLIKYFVKNRHISVLGVPSAEVSEKLKADEAARIEKRLEDLGPSGLKNLAKKLEDAKNSNATPIPDSLFESLPVPNSDSIPWMETTTGQAGLARSKTPLKNDVQKYLDNDAQNLPLFIHFEDAPAKCVYFSLILSADTIPQDLKPLLPIYLLNFFTTPITRDGQRVEFEDMVKQMDQDTISYTIDCGTFNHTELIRIRFVVEPEKYAVAIKWLRDLLFSKIFDVDRLKTATARLLAEIPSSKREGSEMLGAVTTMIHYQKNSAKRAESTLVRALYLKRIKHLLKTNPGEVIKRLETLCNSLYTFSNMRGLVTGEIRALSNPVSAWSPLVSSLQVTDSLVPINPQENYYSKAALSPGGLSYIVPMATIDSSYGYFTTRALGGFNHPRLPALLVALTYLDTADGPLWVAVRGSGLAYGTNFSHSSQTGLLRLSIYRSPDVFKAWQAARDVVADHVSGKTKMDRFAFEGAVSNIVLQFANEQTTIVQAALLGFINPVVLGIPRTYGTELLREIAKVTPEEAVEAMKDLIVPAFRPESANMVVTCASGSKETLTENFKKAGFKSEVQSLEYFQDDYGLEAQEGEGDDEDSGESEEGSEDEEDDESDDDAGTKSYL